MKKVIILLVVATLFLEDAPTCPLPNGGRSGGAIGASSGALIGWGGRFAGGRRRHWRRYSWAVFSMTSTRSIAANLDPAAPRSVARPDGRRRFS